ncbi:MAG TPA: hypothetical protein VMV94_03610 [Phycisphaerae bacterium]|nr:hypothetical protein [Phycisphaerae bacterium]
MAKGSSGISRLHGAFLLALSAALLLWGCGSAVPGSTPGAGSASRVDFRTLGALQDSDDDGLPDMYDPSPTNPDEDGDGVLDGYDADTASIVLPYDPTDPAADSDDDGIQDFFDPNPLDADANDNGVVDGFEVDSDKDGIVDALDHYPGIPDANCNGVLDGEDPDYDNTIDYPSQIRGGEIICGGST